MIMAVVVTVMMFVSSLLFFFFEATLFVLVEFMDYDARGDELKTAEDDHCETNACEEG